VLMLVLVVVTLVVVVEIVVVAVLVVVALVVVVVLSVQSGAVPVRTKVPSVGHWYTLASPS
jgi:hypothetical protein